MECRCRCLDAGLQEADLRNPMLESGLLGRALPLLRRCIITEDQGPFAALSTALAVLPQPVHDTEVLESAAATTATLCPVLLQLYCRTALHLQLAAGKSHTLTAADSPANALEQGPRALAGSQDRQASAERGTFGQQQAAVVMGEEEMEGNESIEEGGMAAAAEAALLESCEVAQKLLGPLQELGASTVANHMVSYHPLLAAITLLPICCTKRPSST